MIRAVRAEVAAGYRSSWEMPSALGVGVIVSVALVACLALLSAYASAFAAPGSPGGGGGGAQPAGARLSGDGGALPLFAGRLSASQSETPSGSATPSQTPSVSDSPSATPSATATPSASPSPSASASGTPSGTATGTPSVTPTVSTSSVFGTRQCAEAVGALLNATREAADARCAHDGGARHRVPMGADLVHGALWRACPAGAAEATYWAYAAALQPADVCYVLLSHSRAATEAVAAGWASAVPQNLWFVGPEADAGLRLLGVPALAGLDPVRWLTKVVPVVTALPAAAACKWWFVGSDTTWVNPRALLHAVRGVPHDTIPSFQGFMWVDQGFTSQITATNGGTSLWSAAGWAAMAARLGTPACPDSAALGLPSDELAVAACADTSGVLAFDFHVYDGSGVFQRNGVPMEPGPPHGERVDWLAQAATRAGHWAWIDGMNADFQRSLWAQYQGMYGPWGKAGAGAGVASPSPGAPAAAAGAPAHYAPPAGAGLPACAVAATATLRGLLEAGRTGAAAAQPLTMELASEAVGQACAPRVARAVEEGLCFLLREEPGAGSGANERLFTIGWGWRTPHAASGGGGGGGGGGSARRLWLASSDASLPAAALAPRESLLALLAAWAALPGTAHCDYLYLGSNTDWVNPPAMAGMLRGLRPDVPLRVGGVVLHSGSGGGEVDAPALGKQVLSRAAVAALVGEGAAAASASCSSGGSGGGAWGDDLNLCAWARGVVPISSFTMDVCNFGPVTDWQWQQLHYLNGWALIVDQDYERAVRILESYWSGIYGQCFNTTQQVHREALPWFFAAWGYPPPPDGFGIERRLRQQWAPDQHGLPARGGASLGGRGPAA
jgi:hypothetical protein